MSNWQVQEALGFVRNTEGLQLMLDLDYYNIFAKRKVRGIYDHDKAIKDLNLRFMRWLSLHYCYKTGSVSLFNIPEEDKTRITTVFLRQLETKGAYILKNKPLNDIQTHEKIHYRIPLELPHNYWMSWGGAFITPIEIEEKLRKPKGYSEIRQNSQFHHLSNKQK